MSLSLPVHPGKRDGRRGTALPSAKTSAAPGDAWGLRSRLLLRWTLATLGTEGHRDKLPCSGGIGWSGTKSLDSPFSLWCYSHKSSHFFCLNCFSVWIALGCVGWVYKISVSHQHCKFCATEDAPSRKDKWRCVGRRNGGLWTPCVRVWMWRVYLMHKGGQSSAMSFNILPSEEWDGTSSRLLMAVFMNNANFVIIQKV